MSLHDELAADAARAKALHAEGKHAEAAAIVRGMKASLEQRSPAELRLLALAARKLARPERRPRTVLPWVRYAETGP